MLFMGMIETVYQWKFRLAAKHVTQGKDKELVQNDAVNPLEYHLVPG